MRPRLIIASVALWCVAGITTGLLRSVQDTAPVAAAESPEPVLSTIEKKADRLPLVPHDSFTDRLLVPPPAVAENRENSDPVASVAEQPKKHHRDTDRVCGDRGRRHFIRHHHRAWRCRR